MKKKSLVATTNSQWYKKFEHRGYRKKGTPIFPSFWPTINTNHDVEVRITIEEI